METFTQKWAIISLLEDTKEGAEFYYTDFPLHVTLAGVFAADQNGKQLADGLAELVQAQAPFTITASEKALFGPDANIAVMKIQKTPELMHLYSHLYSWLQSLGVRYNSPEYQGDGYEPHSTFQKTGSLAPGETRTLRSVSLIDLFPDGNGYQRKIVKTIPLL